MKEYVCVKVKRHEEIGETVSEWQKNAWSLHTYQVTGTSSNPSHFLLFERGD